MEVALLVIAALSLLIALGTVLVLSRADRLTHRLRDTPPLSLETDAPRVSIIVPARNEERHIEQAVRTLLTLDYPRLELVVLDDRSTDSTGEILARLAEEHSRLRVEHISELPGGWLGKNHALQLGADGTEGEYLLFTDADIFFAPTTLRRAVGYAREHGIDHLAMGPEVRVPGFWLRSFVATFTLFFSAYFRPWLARDPRSKAYIGIGAFNLVRREAYERVGGHRPIALRPDDDVKLGKILKQAGSRQESVAGIDLIAVPWYGSVREAIKGLEKNVFAGADYRLSVIAVTSLVMLVFMVWPFLAVPLTTGQPVAQAAYALTALVWLYCCWRSSRNLNQSGIYALGFPICVLLFAFIEWRSTILTYVNDGIYWRDTHYPLDLLRSNKV